MPTMPPPAQLTPGAIVWAYVRDSGGDGQEQSTRQQEAEISAYCQLHSLHLARVYTDEARSGTTAEGREAFGQLFDAIRAGQRPAAVLVWNLARFARNVGDAQYYSYELKRRGVILHSLTDPLPGGDYAELIESLIHFANQEKSRQTSRDSKRALEALVQAGYSNGGGAPRGYKEAYEQNGVQRDGKPRRGIRWVIDPELAEDVRQAFELRAQGKSYGEITKATGGRIYTAANSWTTFFRNKSYLGIGKCGDKEYPNHHPALIDQATFDQVQAIHQERVQAGPRAYNDPGRKTWPSLLSGFAVCAHCGQAMHLHTGGKGRLWAAYRCGRKAAHGTESCGARYVNMRKADQAVIKAVLGQVLTPEYMTQIMAESMARLANTEAIDREIKRLQAALASTEKQINRLLDLVEQGSPAAAERLRQRESERAAQNAELRQAQAKRDAADLKITPEALAMAADQWRARLQDLASEGDILAAKELLTRFVARLELSYNRAEIRYAFAPDVLFPASASPSGGGTEE